MLTSPDKQVYIGRFGFNNFSDQSQSAHWRPDCGVENLGQVITLINVRDDWNAGANFDFSTPIKPLGIKINLSLNEDYNKGWSMINGIENINSSLTHRISLTFDNRKKEKWDIETGGALKVTGSRYSVQNSLNNTYSDFSWFAEARYTPGVHFSFMASADITSYSARSFSESQLVPLVGAEISYYFMKNERGVLTLAGVDLLNRNTGIERESQLNYLVEKRSDIIGRYIMFSFKYRLNKTGKGGGGIDVQVKKR
ncbi:MAG: outer membrane beta-barrel protein [Bacteroidales bacterium]|nr:outer membrane beta-barrel protein [Bacteroidales bacterium]